MGLASPGTIEAVPTHPDKRRKCGTCDWLAQRTEHEMTNYNRMLAEARSDGYEYTLADLHAEMRDSGYSLQYAAFNKHVNGFTCVSR